MAIASWQLLHDQGMRPPLDPAISNQPATAEDSVPFLAAGDTAVELPMLGPPRHSLLHADRRPLQHLVNAGTATTAVSPDESGLAHQDRQSPTTESPTPSRPRGTPMGSLVSNGGHSVLLVGGGAGRSRWSRIHLFGSLDEGFRMTVCPVLGCSFIPSASRVGHSS